MTQFAGGQLFFTSYVTPRSQRQIGKPEPPAKRKHRDTKPARRKGKRRKR